MASSSQGDWGGVIILVLIVILAVSYRVAAHFIDKRIITQYIHRKHGKVQYISWEPFGPGWLGDNLNRIYRVAYVDKNGNLCTVFVKISLMAGLHLVSFTD
jgi:hypothetical protein